jgi:hypothetical protein
LKPNQEEKLQHVIVKQDKLVSEHDYLFGGKKKGDSKIIDVQSKEDFPTLFGAPSGDSGNNGPLWSTPGQKHKPGNRG